MRFWTSALANSLAFLVGLIPKSLRWWLAGRLGWLWFDVLQFRRFTILKNLSIAFPEKPKEERIQIGRRSMQYLCYNLFEFLLIPKMNKKNETLLKEIRDLSFKNNQINSATIKAGKIIVQLLIHSSPKSAIGASIPFSK